MTKVTAYHMVYSGSY